LLEPLTAVQHKPFVDKHTSIDVLHACSGFQSCPQARGFHVDVYVSLCCLFMPSPPHSQQSLRRPPVKVCLQSQSSQCEGVVPNHFSSGRERNSAFALYSRDTKAPFDFPGRSFARGKPVLSPSRLYTSTRTSKRTFKHFPGNIKIAADLYLCLPETKSCVTKCGGKMHVVI
jgi:hypothetical protein